MNEFVMPVQVRWADLDPNFHLRHSVYYDWGSMCRFDYLHSMGLTTRVFSDLKFGPIIFREECVFRKEIKYGDKVSINLQLVKGRKDYSRWRIRHEIMKEENIVAATVTVDGAWMNIVERKLFVPPLEVEQVFSRMPGHGTMVWE